MKQTHRTALLVLATGLATLPCVAPLQAQHPFDPVPVVLTGEPAPGLAAGVSIVGFNAPPNASYPWIVLSAVVDGPGIGVDGSGIPNSTVIYVGSPSLGLTKVVQQRDTYPFADGERTLIQIESPIVDENGLVAFTALVDTGARALFVWDPLVGAPGAIARVGDVFAMNGHTTTGSSFPFSGELVTLATFDARSTAAFHDGQLFFRAAVDPVGMGGLPDAIWYWNIDSPAQLINVANGFQRSNLADTDRFSAFPNLVVDDTGLLGVVNLSQEPTRAVYAFSKTGAGHGGEKSRYHPPPGLFPEKDLRTNGLHWSMLAGVDDESGNEEGDEYTIGVHLESSQIYQNGSSTLGSDRLGLPLGQTITSGPEPESVFAARTIQPNDQPGSPGVFMGWPKDQGPLPYNYVPLLQEGQLAPVIMDAVVRIYAAHVGAGGDIALHVLAKPLLEEEQEGIWRRLPDGAFQPLLASGWFLPLPSGNGTVDSFWTLGTPNLEPVVVGTGRDGHQAALDEAGYLALVIRYEETGKAGLQSGVFRLRIREPSLFEDGFESGDTSRWSVEVR